MGIGIKKNQINVDRNEGDVTRIKRKIQMNQLIDDGLVKIVVTDMPVRVF